MIMKLIQNSMLRMAAGIFASAVMSALYVRGDVGWLLGFVLLVPWLMALESRRPLLATLCSAWAMSVAYTAAVFPWLGTALGKYAGIGETAGLVLLLLGAPLFQPQFLAFALVRHVGGARLGLAMRALAAAAAWVAVESLAPRLLGDMLGYGLYPSRSLRQAADIGGGAGLTLVLLLTNEAFAAALQGARGRGWRVTVQPLVLAALGPLLLAGYGMAVLSGGVGGVGGAGASGPEGKPLRIGLIQANVTDYEALRREKGTHAVVRDVLDRHFAMSYDAVVRQQADAVLWSETAYPTTFAHPKSEVGAEFDREIFATVHAAGVPFVFGTYDRDSAGEYNAAAFLQPGRGFPGFYRKTRLFPFTEAIPGWMDSAPLRQLLPWTGNWKPGNGARVFPLYLADGREVPVLPLICLDDVDSSLALAGARLGAQAILTMSNDSWFSDDPQGARLHQMVAAFRSIETRLPQFRVTTNGYSAAFNAAGDIVAGSPMGQAALVVADAPVRPPVPTLAVRWGGWVGGGCAAFLLLLLAAHTVAPAARGDSAEAEAAARAALSFPLKVAVLPPAARLAAATLRGVARVGLLGMCVALLLDDALRTNTLAQIRYFSVLFLAPEAVAWLVLRAYAAQAVIADGRLVLTRAALRIELTLSDLRVVDPWRLPLPTSGVTLRLAPGRRWSYSLALPDPLAFAQAVAAAGGPRQSARKHTAMDSYVQARTALRRLRLSHPLAKFGLLPLALAIPAFHLHQHIAFGSALGEYYTYGLKAYITAFALWWAAWAIGVVLSASLVRAAIEASALLAAVLRPRHAFNIRRTLERLGHAALYVGLPTWLLLNVLGK